MGTAPQPTQPTCTLPRLRFLNVIFWSSRKPLVTTAGFPSYFWPRRPSTFGPRPPSRRDRHLVILGGAEFGPEGPSPGQGTVKRRLGMRSWPRESCWDIEGPRCETSLAKDPTICSCESRSCEYRLRWSSLWGHEACEGCAEMSGGDACELCHWDLRWSSYGATKRVRGVPT